MARSKLTPALPLGAGRDGDLDAGRRGVGVARAIPVGVGTGNRTAWWWWRRTTRRRRRRRKKKRSRPAPPAAASAARPLRQRSVRRQRRRRGPAAAFGRPARTPVNLRSSRALRASSRSRSARRWRPSVRLSNRGTASRGSSYPCCAGMDGWMDGWMGHAAGREQGGWGGGGARHAESKGVALTDAAEVDLWGLAVHEHRGAPWGCHAQAGPLACGAW